MESIFINSFNIGLLFFMVYFAFWWIPPKLTNNPDVLLKFQNFRSWLKIGLLMMFAAYIFSAVLAYSGITASSMHHVPSVNPEKNLIYTPSQLPKPTSDFLGKQDNSQSYREKMRENAEQNKQ